MYKNQLNVHLKDSPPPWPDITKAKKTMKDTQS